MGNNTVLNYIHTIPLDSIDKVKAMGRQGRRKKKSQTEGIDGSSSGLESEDTSAFSSVDASLGLENGGGGASASSSVDTESGTRVEAVANEADVEIGGDGPKDDVEKWKEDRERVVYELKDSTSDIHLLLSAAASSRADKARRILEKYAPGQQKKQNRVNSISNLIRDFESNKGRYSLSNTTDNKPEWKNSKARDLLYKLRLRRFEGVGAMSSENIYKYHPVFAQYDLGDFKKRDKEMIKLTSKHRERLESDIELFRLHRLKHPQMTISSRGKRIWNNHPAKLKLIADTSSGKAASMKPKQLWETLEEYQDFSLKDFRKHVYQEKYRQLAGPYWQQKRNKAAEKKHYEEVEKMYQEWQDAKLKDDGDRIIEGLSALELQ